MRAWQRRGDVLEADLEHEELRLLSDLSMQLCDVFELVRDGRVRQEDPVIARLFPAAYDDADDAAEFRRLTIEDAALTHLANLESMLEDLVSAEDADAEACTLRIDVDRGGEWLRGLTDLRLVLHERLQQQPAQLHPDLTADDLEQLRGVFDWLGFVQGALLQALEDA